MIIAKIRETRTRFLQPTRSECILADEVLGMTFFDVVLWRRGAVDSGRLGQWWWTNDQAK